MPVTSEARISSLIERHRGWWQRASTKRPLFQVQTGGYSYALHRLNRTLGIGYLEEQRIRPEEFMDSYRWDEPIQSGGDLFVVHQPTSLDWVESVIGCRVVIGGESVWTEQANQDWDEALAVQPDQGWLEKLALFTRTMAETSAGRIPLAHTLMRGPADMVSVLTSHARLCLGIYDAPHKVKALLDRCTEIWPLVWRAQQDHIPSWHGGYCTSYGIWAPGTTLRTQEDASALISPEHYREFLLPCDQRIFELVEYPLIHLHSGALHTVPALLEQERLAAIQVSLDTPAGPPVPKLIPVLAKVLDRKPLIVSGPSTLEDAKLLVEALPPAGLLLILRMEDPEDGSRLEQWFRDRYGE